MSLLALDSLTVRYGGAVALDGVSLRIEAGEIVALVGTSGSGKSTLAAAALGLLPAAAEVSGEVRIEQVALSMLHQTALQDMRGGRVGMVFQEPESALNPALTIGRQIGEVLERHTPMTPAAIEAEVTALLARVGLDVAPDRYPHALSGGQRQRVAIAIAIAARPALLIADEPTAALDALARRGIMDLLGGLVRERGMGLLLVSHDLALVRAMADRIVVLDSGRLVEEGATGALLDRPTSPALAKALAATRRSREARPARDGAPLLELSGVVRSYPASGRLFERRRTVALDRVDLEVRRGETLAVIGESGSGKSTLARLVLGLDVPDAGAVRLGGQPWPRGSASPAMRRRIQAVFQDPVGSLDPRWTVARIVAEPLHLLRSEATPDDRARRVAEALEQVGLSADMAERLPAQFSGGQRQRIALARALVLRPDLVVLDEALSALDPVRQSEMIDLLLTLQERLGLSYLFIAHDMALVRALADRVVVLRQGRVAEQGTVGEVLDRPRDPHVRALIQASALAG